MTIYHCKFCKAPKSFNVNCYCDNELAFLEIQMKKEAVIRERSRKANENKKLIAIPKAIKMMDCVECGILTPKNSHLQKYCPSCAKEKKSAYQKKYIASKRNFQINIIEKEVKKDEESKKTK